MRRENYFQETAFFSCGNPNARVYWSRQHELAQPNKKMKKLYTATAYGKIRGKYQTLAFTSEHHGDACAWLVGKTQKGWIAQPLESRDEPETEEEAEQSLALHLSSI
jgi:hypothetical protein